MVFRYSNIVLIYLVIKHDYLSVLWLFFRGYLDLHKGVGWGVVDWLFF